MSCERQQRKNELKSDGNLLPIFRTLTWHQATNHMPHSAHAHTTAQNNTTVLLFGYDSLSDSNDHVLNPGLLIQVCRASQNDGVYTEEAHECT